MIVMRLSRSTGEKVATEYPRHDMDVIVNCDPDYRYYIISRQEMPTYDCRTHKIVERDEFDNNPHPLYFALGTYSVYYDIEPLDVVTIASNLNTAVGQWIEDNLPLWKQNKYLSRYIYLSQLISQGQSDDSIIAEYNWLGDVDTWANTCRRLRDERENELITNGIIPSFDWPEMPTKNF